MPSAVCRQAGPAPSEPGAGDVCAPTRPARAGRHGPRAGYAEPSRHGSPEGVNVRNTLSRHGGSRVRPWWWRWRHALVCLIAALLAIPAIERAKSAAAQVPPPIDPSMLCPPAGCFPPAPLLNVETLEGGGLYAATPEQVESLRNLEALAIGQVIELHGLSESDRSAVQTWGR